MKKIREKKQYAIDEVFYIPVNGDRQSVHIRSSNRSNPVILFVHGGPGVCDRSWVMPKQSDYLADRFTMVCWDQRMAGKNYRSADARKKMTLDQQVEDMHDVVMYLVKRFGQEKIFIVGHSWGTILSCLYLPKYPENVRAYVGMGQFINGVLNEELSYEYVVNCAKELGDQKAMKDLAKIGAPVGGVYAGGMDALMVQRNYLTKYGGETWKQRGGIYQTVIIPFLTSGEYKIIPDLYRYYKGTFYCLNQLWSDVINLKFDETLRKLDVPVYLFQGDHDQNTPTVLAKKWFDALEAPYKEYVPFHDSAHSPIMEEPELWGRTLTAKLLGA